MGNQHAGIFIVAQETTEQRREVDLAKIYYQLITLQEPHPEGAWLYFYVCEANRKLCYCFIHARLLKSRYSLSLYTVLFSFFTSGSSVRSILTVTLPITISVFEQLEVKLQLVR